MKKLRDSASQGEKKSLEDEEGRKKFGGSHSQDVELPPSRSKRRQPSKLQVDGI